jgi:ribonuclease HIII
VSGRIGVDESGKGDYFGPLVVAACYVGEEHLAELEGVRDSKTLTDKKALALAAVIRRTCPHEVVAIGPTKYNELYAKIGNLNRLLAWGHARAIEELLKKQPATLIVSDQFADPEAVKRRLFELGKQVTLESRVRAEADVAVAAASILARAEFLKRLEQLGVKFGLVLPKGAGPPVLEAGKAFVAKHGEDELANVAKTHFKTTQQVLSGV